MTSQTISPSTTEPEERVLKLWLIFALGFAFSLLLLGGTLWLLFAYETQTWLFWQSSERLDSTDLFGLIRNAVTAAAALGVGVTLFFSYRKQQTAERTLRLGAKAQVNAANALTLATNQYELDRERRADQRIKDLRERFSQAADQLGSGSYALVVAGVHSIETLADEWHELKMDRDRQICINLLCSFVRNPVKDDPLRWPTHKLVVDTLFAHLNPDTPKERYWDANIPLRSAAPAEISNLNINGATLDISGMAPTTDFEGFLYRITLEAGSLILHDANLERESVVIKDSNFSGGTVSIALADDPYEPIGYTGSVIFRSCTFAGTQLTFPDGTNGSIRVRFYNCEFKSPILTASPDACPGKLDFDGCRFDANIFGLTGSWRVGDPYTVIRLHGNDNSGPFVPDGGPGQTLTLLPDPVLGSSNAS